MSQSIQHLVNNRVDVDRLARRSNLDVHGKSIDDLSSIIIGHYLAFSFATRGRQDQLAFVDKGDTRSADAHGAPALSTRFVSHYGSELAVTPALGVETEARLNPLNVAPGAPLGDALVGVQLVMTQSDITMVENAQSVPSPSSSEMLKRVPSNASFVRRATTSPIALTEIEKFIDLGE